MTSDSLRVCIEIDTLIGRLQRNPEAAADVEILQTGDAPSEFSSSLRGLEELLKTGAQPAGTNVEMQALHFKVLIARQRV